jgi:hypothetical protein
MAGGTGHRCVREDQGKAGLRVIGEGEGGWAPTVHRMTTLATATVSATQKLSCMGIRLVAIGAGVVGDRGFEVSALMTRKAGDLEVFAEQRKVCL